MIKTKRILISFVLVTMVFSFSGCVEDFEPHPPTIEFAKKHNLTSPDYKTSEIVCVSKEDITSVELSDLIANTMGKMSKFYLALCQKTFDQMHDRGGDWFTTARMCRSYVRPSLQNTTRRHFIKVGENNYKHEFRYYDGIYPMSRIEKSDLYGHIGIEKTDEFNILYIADVTNFESIYLSVFKDKTELGFIRDAVNEWKKKYPNKCQDLPLK